MRAIKGPFLVSLSVQGTVDSLRNAQLVSTVASTTTIISIVPEGTWVKAGEIVCELDAAQMEDRAQTQQISVTSAEAAEAASAAAVQITKTQNESLIAAAELALQLARLDVDKYIKGEYPQQHDKLSGAVALAQEKLHRANENYEFIRALSRKGYRNQNDVEAERITVKQATLELNAAKEELRVLTDYLKKRTEAELTAKAKEFERDLERVKLQCEAELAQAEKQWEANKQKLDAERDILRKWLDQIEACKLRAPQDGQVVYANLGDTGRRSDGSGGIELGASVRERQAIINLPDVTRIKVDCRIHESQIGSVREGAIARVRISSMGNELFNGRVTSVSSVAMTGRWPNFDLREYKTEITLTDSVEKISRLRPGLTAIVELLVDSRQDVLQVPIQSVVTVGMKNYLFVLEGSGVVRRQVKIGLNNASHMEIVEGIAEGERVVQNPRHAFTDEINAMEAELEAQKANEVATSPEVARPPVGRPGSPAPDAAAAPAQGGGGAGGGRPSPDALISGADKNGDGKLSADEAPEQMKANFAAIDADSDGFVTREELAARFQSRGGRGQGGGAQGGQPSEGGGRGPRPE